ncbi:hypothetical protein jhhlp_001266 [Lomentospora prolificans]|uniref:LsmAD domain-containing protein n=1 Tax=Lomentospora prolificans TaxID=41688 RepID=A0A2N3NHQ8_9PEZI|nr:hypothetical protein jhhlp_001266 [Lomentospora prolificans]
MPLPKKDDRSGGSGRVQNGSSLPYSHFVAFAPVFSQSPNCATGNRPGFRTDAAISNSRFGNERTLKPWVPENSETFGDSLESSSASGPWDQFAANEKLFGLQTDYDENMYTTAIDKSHPQYKERMAAAEKKAREIERSTAATSHVAEERIMDFVGGGDRNGDEEDKQVDPLIAWLGRYSGVKRQDSVASSGRENKYMPPAKRAPTSKATVVGAPVDPAIISSQLKVTQPKKAAPVPAVPTPTPTSKPSEDSKTASAESKAPTSRPEQPKTEKSAESKARDAKTSELSSAESNPGDKSTTPARSPAAPPAPSTRGTTPKTGEATPSAAATVERDVLNSFKNFAAVQRSQAERVRMGKAKADKEVKLTELKNFASTFKLSTPVPSDLISIIAKDPARQKEIQAKALQNAEEVLRAKDAKTKDVVAKETPPKQTTEPSTPAASEQKPTPRPAPSHTSSHPNSQNRHGGGRQAYGSSNFNGQQFRNDRGGAHQTQGRSGGGLAQRIKMQQTPHVAVQIDGRLPPTAPTGGNDGSFNRRLSGTPGHVNKLNPNTQEFRPNAYAPSFSPANPSAASSPRSNVTNNIPDAPSVSPARQLIRRKTKAVDCKKCDILAHIKTAKPPQGRNWDDNAGLRPTYDTPPTWRQLQDDNEKADSTMHLTYKQYFERNPFAGPPGALSTPNPAHVIPMAHQHQLPFHLQQHGAHNMPNRPSPHMPPMQMHAPPQHTPHVGYASTDDHRMMHSNSAQSFASPRLAQAPVYPPAVNSPALAPYGQPVMQPFVPNAPHMGQYRSFSNNPQYMPQQPGHMGSPMMIQPQFVTGPQGMMMAPPQMQMYPTSQSQFIPPGAVSVPPQPIAGSNGYPSPGRPAAPPMAHQGSAQGQPYGMSPSMAYQQPVYTPQQPSPMNTARGYGNPAAHHYGSSPQHMHHFVGPQHRAGSNNYGNKNVTPHGQQHQMNQPNHTIPSGPQARAPEGPEEAK